MSKSGGFSMKRTVCAVATATLAASGLFVSAAHAVSDPLQYGDINKDQPSSLTIHKFESGSLEGQANEASGAATGHGVQGVTFKIHPLNVDLTTNEGWAKISAVQSVPAGACDDQGGANYAALGNGLAAHGTHQSQEKVTAEGGLASFNDLAVGAYLVCEKKLAPGETATDSRGVKVSVVKTSAPFIVTLPRPHANGNGDNKGWLYDVHAYPKNTVIAAPSKTGAVKAKGIGTDDGYEYTITTRVPNLLNDQYFKYFAVIDQMPAQLSGANVKSVTVGQETLTANDDYLVDYTEDSDFLVVNMTHTGLSLLRSKANENVVVKIAAKVDEVSGEKLVNVAYVAVDTAGTRTEVNPPTPVTPGGYGNSPTLVAPGAPALKVSNKTASTWGDIKLFKHDAANIGAGLEGAEFKIYWANDQDNCTSTDHDGNAISVAGKDTFKTEKGGKVTIAGVFLDEANALPAAEPAPKNRACYIVEETKAPAGFVLPTDGSQKKAMWVNIGSSVDDDWKLPNTKVSVPALPLTGASGRVLLMVGGLALVLGSMGVVMVIRKRNAEA